MLALVAVGTAFAGPVKELYLGQRAKEDRWIRLYADIPVSPAVSASATAQSAQTRVFLLVGDIRQAFDEGATQVDGVILPTNDELRFDAEHPETQMLLMSRVLADASLKKAIDVQLKESRKHRLSMANEPVLLPLRPAKTPMFPKFVCLIATDEAIGRSGNYREFFSQRLIAEGIRDCLLDLDSRGVKSVALPLIGAASVFTVGKPGNDRDFAFRRCRMINSIAGIGLGLFQFLPNRKSIDEIGIFQWPSDLERQYPPGTETTAWASIAEYGSRAIETLDEAMKGQLTVPAKGAAYKDCHVVYGVDELGRPMPLPRKR